MFTVQARDDDPTPPYNTITYSIIGDEGVAGVFAISPSTGEITLISPLTQASQNEFRVSKHPTAEYAMRAYYTCYTHYTHHTLYTLYM